MKAWITGALLGLAATGAAAQVAPAPTPPPRAPKRTILFVGNSFTQGAHSAVKRYRADAIVDLMRAGYGGVPALFRTFAEQAGQDWDVSLETQGGKTLRFHHDERLPVIDRRWDVVVLQELSTFSRERPGDPAEFRQYAGELARVFTRRNAGVRVELMATWSRADLVLRPGSRWSGTPIAAMATELAAAARAVDAAVPEIDGVLPVGEAWSRAMAAGVADPDPYDGTAATQVDLWAYDRYHASIHGYYLEALVVFGRIAGVDPRTLGPRERAADDLGIAPAVAVALQRIAAEQLAATP